MEEQAIAAAAPPSRRRRMVGVSLKMYFSHSKTLSYITACATLGTLAPHIDVFLIPDFITLSAAASTVSSSSSSAGKVLLGAQDCFWEDSGAYTGEVSPAVLKDVGCQIVELGHAERRRLFGEGEREVMLKVRAVVRNGMVPLVCIGEKERKGGVGDEEGVSAAVEECRVQVEGVLGGLEEQEQEQQQGKTKTGAEAQVVFAYEPVWAIGAAEPASAAYVVGVVKGLRGLCERMGWGDRVRFLYGGSAGPGTFEGMKEAVDGLFLGRFAHDVGNFEKVVREVGELGPGDSSS